ncbi:MAG TPA: carbon-nitrogen hydrolase family protein [Stellaceae bacterium]|jgi:predicted amidohydrolase|nr:carbon-nitrogen hydrolase family protein [Stellaceae bacterium]
MTSFRIALVQPITAAPPEDERNVAAAVEWIGRAASQGADFVVFPESYPGPWRMPAAYEPHGRIAEAAAKHGIYAVYGTIEPIDAAKATAYNLTCMAYPDGRAPARYRRTHPNGPWIYTGGKVWEFQYVAGDDYPIWDTPHGRIGLAMCSEVYMPEVTRALALRGAELIFMPAGLDKRRLWETWRTLLWARAIENLALVVSTQNLLTARDRGLSIVAAPESILFESTVAGMAVIEVTLDRVRELRNGRDTVTSSQAAGAKQGVLSEQWQRPELYDSFYPRKLPEAAE